MEVRIFDCSRSKVHRGANDPSCARSIQGSFRGERDTRSGGGQLPFKEKALKKGVTVIKYATFLDDHLEFCRYTTTCLRTDPPY